MQSREGLHKLVDSMPEAAIETAHQFLLALQVWPPRPPVDAGKKIMMIEVRTAAGTRRRHMRRVCGLFPRSIARCGIRTYLDLAFRSPKQVRPESCRSRNRCAAYLPHRISGLLKPSLQ